MPRITEFISGLLFGIGLILSGMTKPEKVLGFLDLGGKWDPSLAFVMGGAIGIGLFAFSLAKKRSTSLLGEKMNMPKSNRIDQQLIMGAIIFGIGWGMAGLCPGPVLVCASAGKLKAIAFVLAMIVGMILAGAKSPLPPFSKGGKRIPPL